MLISRTQQFTNGQCVVVVLGNSWRYDLLCNAWCLNSFGILKLCVSNSVILLHVTILKDNEGAPGTKNINLSPSHLHKQSNCGDRKSCSFFFSAENSLQKKKFHSRRQSLENPRQVPCFPAETTTWLNNGFKGYLKHKVNTKI